METIMGDYIGTAIGIHSLRSTRLNTAMEEW